MKKNKHCSLDAEYVGLEIAKKAKAEIHFLHILSTPIDWTKLPLGQEKLYPEIKAQIAHAKIELEKLVQKAEKAGLKAKQFLVFNKGRKEIVAHVKSHKHDFVVMGSHGAHGVKEFIGTNTQRVVRYSSVPVLVVKQKPEKLNIKNMVFAANFKEDVQKPFIKIAEFAALMGANIHLLYVNMPFNFKETDETNALMAAFVKKNSKYHLSPHTYNAFNEESGIMKFAASINANMIALVTHGNTGFTRILTSSVTENLVNHAHIPVLSINIGNNK